MEKMKDVDYRGMEQEPGARFTKHLKPKIFVSPIQFTKILGLRCLVKRAPEFYEKDRIRMSVEIPSYQSGLFSSTSRT